MTKSLRRELTDVPGSGRTPCADLLAYTAGTVRDASVLYVDYRRYPHGILAASDADLTGGFTPASAQQLAAEISAPPLPADLELIDSGTFTRAGD